MAVQQRTPVNPKLYQGKVCDRRNRMGSLRNDQMFETQTKSDQLQVGVSKSDMIALKAAVHVGFNTWPDDPVEKEGSYIDRQQEPENNPNQPSSDARRLAASGNRIIS